MTVGKWAGHSAVWNPLLEPAATMWNSTEVEGVDPSLVDGGVAGAGGGSEAALDDVIATAGRFADTLPDHGTALFLLFDTAFEIVDPTG